MQRTLLLSLWIKCECRSDLIASRHLAKPTTILPPPRSDHQIHTTTFAHLVLPALKSYSIRPRLRGLSERLLALVKPTRPWESGRMKLVWDGRIHEKDLCIELGLTQALLGIHVAYSFGLLHVLSPEKMGLSTKRYTIAHVIQHTCKLNTCASYPSRHDYTKRLQTSTHPHATFFPF